MDFSFFWASLLASSALLQRFHLHALSGKLKLRCALDVYASNCWLPCCQWNGVVTLHLSLWHAEFVSHFQSGQEYLVSSAETGHWVSAPGISADSGVYMLLQKETNCNDRRLCWASEPEQLLVISMTLKYELYLPLVAVTVEQDRIDSSSQLQSLRSPYCVW